MQGEFQIDFAGWFPDDGARDSCSLHLRADAALFANMGEIGGEAVAEVDHRRGQTFLQKEPAYFDARSGMEVAGEVGRSQFPAGEQQLQGGGGAS